MAKNRLNGKTGGVSNMWKWWMYHHRRFQHVYQNIFRITDAGDNRITDAGDTRITDDSDY